jgi:DNA invertase Pin-like site-specific DNA recombinase
MTAALYARVSTKDKGQDTENQLKELRAFAERLGYSIYKEYVDEESGTTAERPQFKQLFLDAHQRRYDVVLFWALDRFTREGPLEALSYLHRLREHGVNYISFQEQYLNSLGPWQQAIEGFLATIAKQESARRSERTKAGMSTARVKGTKSGKAIGRPTVPVATVARMQDLRAQGWSIRRIAADVELPVATVHQYTKKEKVPAE